MTAPPLRAGTPPLPRSIAVHWTAMEPLVASGRWDDSLPAVRVSVADRRLEVRWGVVQDEVSTMAVPPVLPLTESVLTPTGSCLDQCSDGVRSQRSVRRPRLAAAPCCPSPPLSQW